MNIELGARIGRKLTFNQNTPDEYKTYLPGYLPPKPLHLEKLLPLIEATSQSLGVMDGLCQILPNKDLFLFLYVRKEALLSSQIEGTQSSLSELVLYDQKKGDFSQDTQDVSNYVKASFIGIRTIIDQEMPITLNLIRELHRLIIGNHKGRNKNSGNFRTNQNWVGGTKIANAIYVPPPANLVKDYLSDLEKFINLSNASLPALLTAGIAHHQFETIHPFLDGNGRLGRLLISLILCKKKIISEPIIYPSLYFKLNRKQYYELLQSVRDKGNWEDWLEFFLNGINYSAKAANETAKKIIAQIQLDSNKISHCGRKLMHISKVYDYFKENPISDLSTISQKLSLSIPTVTNNVKLLQKLEIIYEISGHKRGQVFSYRNYLNILETDIETN